MNEVYILISNSRSIVGVWRTKPTEEQQAAAYSDFLGKIVDYETVINNCWIETHAIR